MEEPLPASAMLYSLWIQQHKPQEKSNKNLQLSEDDKRVKVTTVPTAHESDQPHTRRGMMMPAPIQDLQRKQGLH